MLEKDIEKAFGRALGAWAVKHGHKVGYVKFASPGERGWPDRLVLFYGRTIWIEWKKPGGQATAYQEHIHAELRAMGHDVRVYDDWRAALDEITKDIYVESGHGLDN